MFEFEILTKLKEAFEEEKPARSVEFSEEQQKVLKQLHLLTTKPVLYVANVSEDEVADPSGNEYVQKVREFAAAENAEVIVVCAKLSPKSQSLKAKRRRCSLKNSASKNPVWIS